MVTLREWTKKYESVKKIGQCHSEPRKQSTMGHGHPQARGKNRDQGLSR